MGETNEQITNVVTEVANQVAGQPTFWDSYGTTLIWACVIGVLFVVLWRKGQLERLANYVRGTREELKKCTWPSREELKGSTVLVIIAIALLGGFTVVVDFILTFLVQNLT
jgi:preprotein translocase subunit SecE